MNNFNPVYYYLTHGCVPMLRSICSLLLTMWNGKNLMLLFISFICKITAGQARYHTKNSLQNFKEGEWKLWVCIRKMTDSSQSLLLFVWCRVQYLICRKIKVVYIIYIIIIFCFFVSAAYIQSVESHYSQFYRWYQFYKGTSRMFLFSNQSTNTISCIT